MTTAAAPNPANYLSYVANEAGRLLDAALCSLSDLTQHQDVGGFEASRENVLGLIEAARIVIDEAKASTGLGERYDDGRPVTTSCELQDGNRFSFTAHPLPEHPHNRPRPLATVDALGGGRDRVILRADHSLVALRAERLQVAK